jgi:adenine-specific DNA-methyltransferase
LVYDNKALPEEVLSGPPARLRWVRGSETDPARIIYGENLRVLRALQKDPTVSGQVRLVYIDPPFATRHSFETRTQEVAYDDPLTGAHYLEFLRQRLILLRELMAEDGSIYVHLDDNMAFASKVLLDEVFGVSNFRNLIVRKKCNPKNYTRKQYGNVTDYILFYSKSRDWVWNHPSEPHNEQTLAREYRHVDPGTGKRYMLVPVHAPGTRNGATGQQWRGRRPPPGKHWQYTPETLDELDARGEIYWSATGNPRRKVFLDERKGVPAQDLWLEFKDAHNQNVRVTGYPTEKNLDLIGRIVEASSNRGDLVLDAFGGSGTTAVACEERGRPWILIDNSPLAIKTIVRRLRQGSERMGDYVTARRSDVPQLFDVTTAQSRSFALCVEESDETAALTWDAGSEALD